MLCFLLLKNKNLILKDREGGGGIKIWDRSLVGRKTANDRPNQVFLESLMAIWTYVDNTIK